MTGSAIFMFAFSATILWGGLATFITIAVKKSS